MHDVQRLPGRCGDMGKQSQFLLYQSQSWVRSASQRGVWQQLFEGKTVQTFFSSDFFLTSKRLSLENIVVEYSTKILAWYIRGKLMSILNRENSF